MMKILVTSRMFGKLEPKPLELLKNEGYELIDHPLRGNTIGEDDLVNMIAEFDAAIVGDDYFSAKVIEKAKNLKVIAKYGVGVDRIDLEAATKKGILVANVPAMNKHAVADLTMTLMLALSRQLRKAEEVVRSGGWNVVIGREVYRKTLGVVGMGQIGKEVIKRAKGFDMNILAYEPFPDQSFADQYGVKLTDIETLFSESDMVTLHVPSLPGTKNMITEKLLTRMKHTAYLINTARGDIINETDLIKVLQQGLIAGAALDALEDEPPGDNPLIRMDNVIITPHIGAHTFEANYAVGMVTAQNVMLALKGEKAMYTVNPEVYELCRHGTN